MLRLVGGPSLLLAAKARQASFNFFFFLNSDNIFTSKKTTQNAALFQFINFVLSLSMGSKILSSKL